MRKPTRYDVYTVVTLLLIIGVMWVLRNYWISIFIVGFLVAQYEFAHFHVSEILRMYVMYERKAIKELRFSKIQSVFKKLFRI